MDASIFESDTDLIQVNNIILTAIAERDIARSQLKKILNGILFTCPICMMPVKETIETSCGHRFCISCTKEWLKENETCPNCRHEVRSEVQKELELGPLILESINLDGADLDDVRALLSNIYRGTQLIGRFTRSQERLVDAQR